MMTGFQVFSVLSPLLAACLILLIPARGVLYVGRIGAILCGLVGLYMPVLVSRAGQPLVLHLGGWPPPLGITIHCDGLAALFIAFLAVVMMAVSLHPSRCVRTDPMFWPLLFLQWAALNALFQAHDLFNLYVTLELVTISSVGLVMRSGTRAALHAAFRYLLMALAGSLSYLLGVVIVYGIAGQLDMNILTSLPTGQATRIAVGLLCTGLLLKAALFPLHFWLPPAHAGAPPPVSAILSAAVVAGAWLALFRIWHLLPADAAFAGLGQLLGWAGCLAILWGGVLAIRQEKLKSLVAYSTVSQLGYFFLFFSFVAEGGDGIRSLAWTGTIAFVIAHGLAKAAAFLVAGDLVEQEGSPRLADMQGAGLRHPWLLFTFSLAGINLMGLPPTAGFSGKWMLLKSAILSGRYEIAIVILAGGVLAAIYVFRVLNCLMTPSGEMESGPRERTTVIAPLVLASLTVVLALSMAPVSQLLGIGAPTLTALGELAPGVSP